MPSPGVAGIAQPKKEPVSRWGEIPPPAPERAATTGKARRLLALAVVSAALWSLGHVGPAAVLAVTAAVLLVIGRVRPGWLRRLDGIVARIGHPIASVASALLAGAFQLLIFMPVALIGRLAGRTHLSTPISASYWIDRRGSSRPELHRRQFGVDVTPFQGHSKKGIGELFRSIAVAVTGGLLLNLAAGITYEQIVRQFRPSEHFLPVASAALRDQPAIRELDAEMLRLTSRWDPLMGSVRNDFEGVHVNIRNLERKTFAPPTSPGSSMPEVYFLGGSTMFGTGQRDLYTIPSQIARRAAADAHPIRAVNYGQGAFVIWQEVELLERLLTTGHTPDVVVFYNGANEVSTHVSHLTSDPSYPQAAEVRRRLRGRPAPRALYDAYARHSAVHKIRAGLRGSPERPPSTAALTQERADNAARLHARAVDLLERLADAYGFRALFFWQPIKVTQDTGGMATTDMDDASWSEAYRAATARIAAPTIDLSDALDSSTSPLYFDRVHTNEQGAAMVADAMYPAIVEAIRAS